MATTITTVDQSTAPSPAPLLAEFIVKTPGTCNGEPRIIGTRIKVKHVYGWVEVAGHSPAWVVAEFPHLTMAQVHAALAYYWSHQEEIQRDIAEEERFVAEMKAKAPPSLLQQRLAERNAKDDPLPPG